MAHIPERTCIACRTKRPKAEMLRLVRTGDGRAALDPQARQPGRGAYLCAAAVCWQAALRGSRLDRALRTALQASTRQALLAALEEHSAVRMRE